MFDTHVAKLVLNERKIAYLTTDRALMVIGYGGNLPFLAELQAESVDSHPSRNSVIDLLGAPINSVLPELIGSEEQLHMLLAGDLPTIRLDYINRENIQGELVYLTLTLYPHLDEAGIRMGILALLEDVTPIGRAAQQLTQQHNELALLHRQLNAANWRLTAANAELRALDELKSRFVSIAAHELRTPIATMLGYMDFMLEEDQDKLSPDQQKSLNIVRRSTKRLLTITTDLLDVTRLEAGRLELILESVNLERLIDAVLTEFQPQLQQKQLVVTFNKPAQLPPVLCDEKRTLQIFTNLISNAIKYTPERGRITIDLHHSQDSGLVPHQRIPKENAPKETVQPAFKIPGEPAMIVTQRSATLPSTLVHEAMPEEAALILVDITDTGIGIPAADLANMGKAFFRASNVHHARATGTGLGLHITQALCELQGGNLWIKSQEGIGTTASVTIPVDDGIFDR